MQGVMARQRLQVCRLLSDNQFYHLCRRSEIKLSKLVLTICERFHEDKRSRESACSSFPFFLSKPTRLGRRCVNSEQNPLPEHDHMHK